MNFSKIFFLIVITALKLNSNENIIATHIANNKTAKTIIIFSSFTCYHCAKFYNDEFPQIKKKLIDNGILNFKMIDYPQDKISLYATKLVYFANKYKSNEKAFAIKKAIYKNQKYWIGDYNQSFDTMRKNLNKKILELNILDEKNLENILNDKNLEKELLNTIYNYAKNFDIDGFPAFIEGGKNLEKVFSARSFLQKFGRN